ERSKRASPNNSLPASARNAWALTDTDAPTASTVPLRVAGLRSQRGGLARNRRLPRKGCRLRAAHPFPAHSRAARKASMTPPYARRMARVAPSAIMELIKTPASGDYISSAGGLPDPSLYPFDALRAIADEILVTDGRAGLQYGPAEGYPPLRAWIAERLRARGLD